MNYDPISLADVQYFGVFAALAAGAGSAGIRCCTPYDEPFAELYDVDGQGAAGDLEFFGEAAERCGGPVLDLACGSGRIAVALARAGHRVDGIDRSIAMLTRARPGTDGVRLFRGDVLTPPNGTRYGLVVVGATMFATFLARGGHPWLERLHAIVRPGGGLCFDVGRGYDGAGDLRVRETDHGPVLQGFAFLPNRQGHVFNAYAERDLGRLGTRHLASETIFTPPPASIVQNLEHAGWQVIRCEALPGSDAYLACTA